MSRSPVLHGISLLGAALCMAVLLLGMPVPAQEPAGGTFRVKVDLVTIETAVLDKGGKPVSGLKKENFRLFEDGKEQRILTLDTLSCQAPGTGDAGAGLRGKIVLILFDDSTVGSAEIRTIREAAEIYVKKHMGPADWFAVTVFWRNLKVTQNFTQDAGKVLAAIRRPASSMDTSPGSPTARAGTIGSLDLVRSLIDLTSSLERTPGRKAVLVFTNDFYNPSHNHYSRLLETARRADVSFYTLIARRASARGSTSSPTSRSEDIEEYPAAVRPAGSISVGHSTSGSVLKTAPLLGPLASSFRGASEQQSSPREQQSLPKVMPNDPYTPQTRSNTGDASSAGQYNDSITGDCLRGLAEATGGDIVQESSDLVAALDSFEQGLCRYYVLGFQSSNPRRDGKMRKIEVKTDVKGVRLKYRPGYIDARPVDLFAGDKSEKALLEAVSSPASPAALPFTFHAYYFYESPESVRVPVFMRIRRSLVDKKQKSAKSGSGANVMGAAFAEDGRIVARFSQALDLAAMPDQAGPARDDFVSFNSLLRLRPGAYRLRLAVSDEQGRVGAAEETLSIPAREPDTWGVGSLVASQRIEPLPEIVRSMQSQLLDENDPFLFKGHQIVVSADNQFLRQQPLLLLYRLYNLKDEELNHSLIADIRLRDESGVSHLLQPVRLNKVIQPVSPGVIAVGFSLTLADRAPGKYQLIVDTVDETAQRSITCQTGIELR